MIAFQEVSQVTQFESRRTWIEKSGKRSLFPTNTEDFSIIADPKKEPNALDIISTSEENNLLNDSAPWIAYFLWLLFRL